MSQGSILVPLLSNIFINDLFLFIKRFHFCNFAEDKNVSDIFQDLVCDYENVLNWF